MRWLNVNKISPSAIKSYQSSLSNSCPNYVVIDDLFDHQLLCSVLDILKRKSDWKTQRHTYSSLYVNDDDWQHTDSEQRFVQRDCRARDIVNPDLAEYFLQFLRSEEFMAFLSAVFKEQLSDQNLDNPKLNSNYFRLAADDFVDQHADDSPGRKVCLLLYLNEGWHDGMGGELRFLGNKKPVKIAPIFNRCILFNPSSRGSEHWVAGRNQSQSDTFRYNVTSWYWSY